MTLKVDIEHRFGAFHLRTAFAAGSGLTALFGRSGSGKTSVVNAIAGLFRPNHGRIEVDGEVLLDSEAGIFVPPHRRRVGYVFQEPRLFPHLSVRQNLLYGRWFNRRGPAEGLDRIVDLLGLDSLLDRRPAGLSGGEKQRVAIGRALLARPRLLLMDEPLSALDEGRKNEILPYVERLRDDFGIPIVYVSHAVAEVTRLADTLVVLSEGRVAASGGVVEIMGRGDLFPLTGRAEAGAVLVCTVERHDEANGLTLLASSAGLLTVPRLDLPPGRDLRVRIRSRDVIVALDPPGAISALNVLAGRIARVFEGEGPIGEVEIDCGGQRLLARLTRFSIGRLGLTPGLSVYAFVKAVAVDRHALGVRAVPRGGAGSWVEQET